VSLKEAYENIVMYSLKHKIQIYQKSIHLVGPAVLLFSSADVTLYLLLICKVCKGNMNMQLRTLLSDRLLYLFNNIPFLPPM